MLVLYAVYALCNVVESVRGGELGDVHAKRGRDIIPFAIALDMGS